MSPAIGMDFMLYGASDKDKTTVQSILNRYKGKPYFDSDIGKGEGAKVIISETLDFFKWVQRGEQRFIMPHKDKAMFDIDTFIAYEPAVYKPIILDELLEARNTYPEYEPFKDLEEFLTEIEGMDMDLVPANSLVREFVGGSHYDY